MTETLPHDTCTGAAARRHVLEQELQLEVVRLAAEAANPAGSPTMNGGFRASSSNPLAASSTDGSGLVERCDDLAARVEQACEAHPDSEKLQQVLREAHALSGRVFLRARGVPRLLDGLVQQLLATRPADPVGEMVRLLAARATTTAASQKGVVRQGSGAALPLGSRGPSRHVLSPGDGSLCACTIAYLFVGQGRQTLSWVWSTYRKMEAD